MKMNFYNYDIIAKRMNYIHPLLIKFINDHQTENFEQLNNLIKEKFNTYGAEFGMITIDTKILATLKITKKEIKSLIKNKENISYIYNKDFETIIHRINTYNKINYNVDLSMLKLFFKCSLNNNSDFITLNLKSKEI